MKKVLSFAGILLGTIFAFAQVPEKMSYQAVVRNSSGQLLQNQNVGVKVSILQNSDSGTVVYSERLTGTTNTNGLVSLAIGTGTVLSGTFNTINWSTGNYYLKTETDPTGGTSYTIAGTSQLLSVPYAMYAKSSGGAATLWNSSGSDIYNANTGNVGVGTNSPAYKFDLLHGGSTGIRLKSSSSYSTLDIDGFTGDAAVRFANNGVNQWNVRNNPADNSFQVFELGGGGERFMIQDGTGNIGIGGVVPTYRLHVLHGGSTGIKVQSSSSYSVLDIDGFSGDAAVRFANNGVNQWNVRNNPADNSFQIFELGGGGERFQIQDGTGNVGIGITSPTAKLHVGGNFTATGVKAFTIDHPLDPENKILRHFAIESNEVINTYSGNAKTDNSGKVTVKLPDYFESINKDFRYQLTVIGAFAQAIISKKVSNNQFEISTSTPNVEVSWQVIGTRNDLYMQKINTMKSEELKTNEMKGRYIEPKAYGLPESRGVNYSSSENKNDQSSILDNTISKIQKNESSGGSIDQK